MVLVQWCLDVTRNAKLENNGRQTTLTPGPNISIHAAINDTKPTTHLSFYFISKQRPFSTVCYLVYFCTSLHFSPLFSVDCENILCEWIFTHWIWFSDTFCIVNFLTSRIFFPFIMLVSRVTSCFPANIACTSEEKLRRMKAPTINQVNVENQF